MAHFYRMVALAILLLPVCLSAQERITAQPVSPQTVPALKNIFKKYALFEFNTQALDQTVKKAAAQGEVNLELELPGYSSFKINMHQHDIMSTDYKLVVGTPQGRQEFPKPDCMTYSGVLTGQGNSDVRLTITGDLIYGILSGNNKSWFIEPVRYLSNQVKENLYVVYETTDVIPKTDIGCGVSEIMTRQITDNGYARVEGSATGTCKMIEVAIASDDSMYIRYGNATKVQEHNIAVMNTMVGLYSNTQIGTQYLEFIIKGQYVSTVLANNALSPVTANADAGVLLANFRTWGNAGNFGFTYDMGAYWTTKNITYSGSAGVIGLASINAVCTSYKYQVLEDYGGSGLELGLLAAHETGHNLGAQHDASGDPYIMAPAVNASSITFSPASITYFTNFLALSQTNCLSLCNTIQPVAQFNASATNICTGNNITFTNYSVGQVTGVSWAFQDGSPATSTAQAPAVTFSTAGIKTITLTATNANGSNSITKQVFVGDALTGTGCRTNIAGTSQFTGLLSFILQDISHNAPTVHINGNYFNYTCANTTVLQPATTYTATADMGFYYGGYDIYSRLQLFIDYNGDGDFLDTDEAVYTDPDCRQKDIAFTFTTPAVITAMDKYLRLRVVARACNLAATDGCSIPAPGGGAIVEDYAVFFTTSSTLPLLLTSFDGYYSNGKNELNWKTETEVNTDHFVVERSFNGADYVEAGKVPAKGLTGNLINFYQFTDGLINADNFNRFYYRLKMVDKDGAYKYSKLVITTRPNDGNLQVLVYPNPVSRNTTLQIKKADNNMSVIEVFNSMGQRVYTKRMTANLYNTSIDIPGNWSPGIYMIRVSDSKLSWSRAVMVK
jgi:PKD repeat protein